MGSGQKTSIRGRADIKFEGQCCPHVLGVHQDPAASSGTTQLISPRWLHYFSPHFTAGKLRFRDRTYQGLSRRSWGLRATHSLTHAFSSIDGELNDVLGPELGTLELV